MMKEEGSDEIGKRAEVKTWGYMRKWVYEGQLLKTKIYNHESQCSYVSKIYMYVNQS